MTKQSAPVQATAHIRALLPDNFAPKVGIVLGSGLGAFAERIDEVLTIPYTELPDFPALSVAGHAGCLTLGWLEGVPVACLQGRVHYYEGGPFYACLTMIRTLRLLGCDILLSTNASGSLREEVGPGSLVTVSDHINFQGNNPLVGANDDEFGPRFLPMETVYDVALREQLRAAAATVGIALEDGVYLGVLGPNFETPAEIRLFKQWGADLLGMSTIPEVIAAHHCGLRVAVLALITNYAVGLSDTIVTHDVTLEQANLGVDRVSDVISIWLKLYNQTL